MRISCLKKMILQQGFRNSNINIKLFCFTLTMKCSSAELKPKIIPNQARPKQLDGKLLETWAGCNVTFWSSSGWKKHELLVETGWTKAAWCITIPIPINLVQKPVIRVELAVDGLWSFGDQLWKNRSHWYQPIICWQIASGYFGTNCFSLSADTLKKFNRNKNKNV